MSAREDVKGLVDRLMAWHDGPFGGANGNPIFHQAFDALEALSAENERLRESLEVRWECFGCGAEFADDEYEQAKEHFGLPGEREKPACARLRSGEGETMGFGEHRELLAETYRDRLSGPEGEDAGRMARVLAYVMEGYMDDGEDDESIGWTERGDGSDRGEIALTFGDQRWLRDYFAARLRAPESVEGESDEAVEGETSEAGSEAILPGDAPPEAYANPSGSPDDWSEVGAALSMLGCFCSDSGPEGFRCSMHKALDALARLHTEPSESEVVGYLVGRYHGPDLRGFESVKPYESAEDARHDANRWSATHEASDLSVVRYRVHPVLAALPQTEEPSE